MGALNHEWIQTKHELESIREEWEEVLRNSATKSPFLTFAYIKLWYECFAKPDSVRVYRVDDGGRTIGFLPMVLNSIKGLRILRNLTNDHCLNAGPLVQRGYELRFQDLLIKSLMATQSDWDVIQDSFSYSFSRYPGLFPDCKLNEQKIRWEKKIQPTFLVRFGKNFEHYLRSEISQKTKRSFKLNRNRLAKAGKVIVHHYRDSEAKAQWKEFIRLEDSGWKGQAGSSIKKLPHRYQAYYEGFVHLLAIQQMLHLYLLEVNGEVIAGGFGYQEDDIFHYAKAGYDEHFGCYSPSNILLMYIIEDFFSRFPKIQKLHMYPWDYGYKHRYSNEQASHFETTMYSTSMRGSVAYRLRDMKRRLKRIKTFLTRTDKPDAAD